ncbi:chemotaxis protein CheA [Colwellia sp. MB3u-70]|uniref:chemotaxis protein CheA n=1 Tax=unclassified Colwellia TaxID=196834 RepID=UPI0015F4C47C|nr:MULTISPECIES: chemotaxis protein CheA [unclassified Colwellia]MBA6291776.1 chemotaxis protein CheA [Colwellia sp. MB3u-8]MBA6308420.1 chemotaxis protein CheA [Colwellia sp. MB3u-70]
MSFAQDDEILQDFLIEAGEILETLSEQLVELENDPENAELLNAIFRGFHTVKGGAGFLSLAELVDACHGAENVFDTLRNQQRSVTSSLMDVILKALDTINEMFAQVQNKAPLSPAEPSLLAELHRLSQPEGQAESVVENALATADENIPAADSNSSDEMSEDEFERLLDELHGSGVKKASAPAPVVEQPTTLSSDSSNDISDDEFESLLDELHGQGAFSPAVTPAPASTANSASADEIDDDDFESLLDELHGKNQRPKAQAPAKPAGAVSAVTKAASVPAANKITAKPAVNQLSASADKKTAPAKPAQGETTVRVDTKRLDQIMNMVGELVLVRNRLASLGMTKEDEELTKALSNLDAVTTDLQGAVMKTRMQPIKKVFGRFPRVVRDLARSLNKEIKLVLKGEETDLDKNLVEALADPLVHLVRNSVDHGIEAPDTREAAGKPREGIVLLSASQEGDHILLTIRDDGAGMNADKLKEIAIKRGVLDADAAARMSDKEAFSLIFAPGFSTKTEISEVSGRGVGMDVVKTKITQLNGTVSIDSEIGVGTILEIKVPLTLAILPTLMVVIGQQTFALPLAVVNEIFHLDLTKTNVVDGQLTIIVREKSIPLFYLDQWLVRNYVEKSRELGHVVIVQLGNQKVGFVVDSLIGQEEVVIKPLDRLLNGTPGMAGATITSDGGIALIIDVPNMLKFYAKKSLVNKKLRS